MSSCTCRFGNIWPFYLDVTSQLPIVETFIESWWNQWLSEMSFCFCNIQLLRTPDWTYSLRTFVCKWSGSLYDWLFRLWIMMLLWIWWYAIFFIFISTCAFDWLFLSVEDSILIKDVNGINGTTWTPDWVKGWIVIVWVFLILHMWHINCILWCWFFINNMFVDGCRMTTTC
jgi:hypothetical protein